MIPIIYFLLYPLLVKSQLSFWNKHYLTYSVENDFHWSEKIKEAIQEWDIHTLEIENVQQGKGDIKIYFENELPDYVIGQAWQPEEGILKINRKEINKFNVTKVIQHEFGHTLGLQHSKNPNSIMFSVYDDNQKLLKSDKEKLNELYKCRYDSVTLLNSQTYLKFKGKNYERIDLNTEYTTQDKVWHPAITKVNFMYRNITYFIISNDKYFEFNHTMHFIKEGSVRDIFPNILHNISSVLTLRNGSLICFHEDGHIWHNNAEIFFQNLPNGKIQGAFADDNYIYLVIKDYIYTYDENFLFVKRHRLCNDPKLGQIHCCNDYSNI